MLIRDTWNAFFMKVGQICEARLDYEPTLLKEGAVELIRNVVKRLSEKDTLKEVEAAITKEAKEEERNKDSINFLEEEMKLFINSVSKDFEKKPTKEILVCRLSQAKTIKDSINDLISLPKWIKKILDILLTFATF